MDAAIAAAVIGSITAQFRAPDVRVQLQGMEVRPASIQDRQVTGFGRLRIDGDSEWIPFKFAALYDTSSTEVSYPQLQLAGGTSAPVVARSSLARQFNAQVTSALASEFTGQQVRWTLAHATSVGTGRFVRIDGDGSADFGSDGRTRAHVQGMFDTRTGQWTRVHYELGPGSEWIVGTPSVASL